MAKILILGASGQIARHVVDMLAGRGDAEMTLFLRDAKRLGREVEAPGALGNRNIGVNKPGTDGEKPAFM